MTTGPSFSVMVMNSLACGKGIAGQGCEDNGACESELENFHA
jgi:hypothetical protein